MSLNRVSDSVPIIATDDSEALRESLCGSWAFQFAVVPQGFMPKHGDGDLDVVSASGLGLRSLENLDGQGEFRESEPAMTDWDYLSLILDLADVDADGDQDLLCAAFNRGRVMWLENVDGRGSLPRLGV